MNHITIRQRPATSVLELLLFIGIFAICSTVVLTLFFSTNEQRVRQQIVMGVEQSALQLMQTVTHRTRTAEAILDPVMGSSGGFLALQIAIEELNPTIIGVQTGSLIAVQADTAQTLSNDQFTVSNFWVENTSVAADKPSARIHLEVTGTVPLPQPTPYKRRFETTVTLFPNHQPLTHCGCTAPSCSGGLYTWEHCPESACSSAGTVLICGSSSGPGDDDDD